MVLIMSNIVGNHTTAMSAERKDAVERPAIVLVAFGTSNAEARKVFDHIDAAARKRFPQHEIHWAFTSAFIRAKLKNQGIELKSPDEVVQQLRQAGQQRVVFQSLHVAPGQEYEEIRQVDTSGLQTAVGGALLADADDIRAVAAALKSEIQQDAANVVVCHGNESHPKFNRQLIAIAGVIEARHDNVVVCSINGQPGTDKLADAKREAATSGRVNFIPLMVVAGVHVAEDILGDDVGSWKSIVGAKVATCTKPLGYNDQVLAVYFEHLDEALATLKTQPQTGDRP